MSVDRAQKSFYSPLLASKVKALFASHQPDYADNHKLKPWKAFCRTLAPHIARKHLRLLQFEQRARSGFTLGDFIATDGVMVFPAPFGQIGFVIAFDDTIKRESDAARTIRRNIGIMVSALFLFSFFSFTHTFSSVITYSVWKKQSTILRMPI
jgi:hypothetical protein